jgi:pimeloyl-ACP methyl ester carboxylesterase
LQSKTESDWKDAWARASQNLEGVTRRRVRGGSPGVEIALLDWGGTGDLALLHHANGFCGATLAPIAKALSSRFRVVAVDARGHGDSTHPEPGADVEPFHANTFIADLVAALPPILELVGRDRVELAIGHSIGGAVVLGAAEEVPDLFARILLCDPVIFPAMTPEQKASRTRGSVMVEGALKRRERFPSREEAFEHFRTRSLFSQFPAEALALYVAEGLGPTADGDFALKCDREVEAAIFGGGAMIDLYDRADRVTAEVLFLHALRGNFVRDVYDRLAAKMPRARVESLDVGHLFPMEAPAEVLAAVERLLESR